MVKVDEIKKQKQSIIDMLTDVTSGTLSKTDDSCLSSRNVLHVPL
jgi:phenylpyruvate tautomerase PptA (4-oxalocrotonate tautomerase family)